MKISRLASSILLISCIFLAGCDSLGLPDLTKRDEVPPEVKAQPRPIQSQPESVTDRQPWPRLGDVPFAPKDFSPKPVYNHYMNELEYDRAEAQDAKHKVEQESPAIPDMAVPQGSADAVSPAAGWPVSHAPPAAPLTPPQLPEH